jgi:hypothetical protein
MNSILIHCCRSKIFELCYFFKGTISCRDFALNSGDDTYSPDWELNFLKEVYDIIGSHGTEYQEDEFSVRIPNRPYIGGQEGKAV